MSVRKDKKNGKWYCRFQIKGERHHFCCEGATNAKDAKLLEDQFRYKVQQQINGVIPREVKKESISFRRVIKKYLLYSENKRKTFEQDLSRCHLMLKYFGRDKNVLELHSEDIESFKNYLLSQNRCQVTVNLYLGILSMAFKLAIDDKLIKENPIKPYMKFKKKNYKINYLTEEQEKRLFEAAPDYFKPILIVALNTGLRRTNILELKWSNIDFEFKTIEILENKGNKHIILPINRELLKLLNDLKAKSTSEYVFLNPETNQPYSQSAFMAKWHSIRKKANLEKLRFHDLRHTVGTRLSQKTYHLL